MNRELVNYPKTAQVVMTTKHRRASAGATRTLICVSPKTTDSMAMVVAAATRGTRTVRPIDVQMEMCKIWIRLLEASTPANG